MEQSMQHPTALVATDKIGARTRIWAFVNICPGAVIGSDCNICDHVFIENNVRIGDRVTIKCGTFVWDGVTLEDDVFIGPGVAFTNDLYPRSKVRPPQIVPTLVRHGASIGANATILAGITIGANAMVGAGSVVTKDVPPNAIVRGNPARIGGYVDAAAETHTEIGVSRCKSADLSRVNGVKLIEIPKVVDLRGTLSFGEVDQHLPFIPKRYFLIYDVPSKDIRGEHAHRSLQQLLFCVRGNCHVLVDDGHVRAEMILSSPNQGLYVGPMVWSTQYKYSTDAVLMVLASEKYDATDYIRDYEQFLIIANGPADDGSTAHVQRSPDHSSIP